MRLSELLQTLLPDAGLDLKCRIQAQGPIPDLLKAFPSSVGHLPAMEITAVQYDSRLIKPGGLFVAIPGFTTDGHHHVQDAVDRGALAVVVQRPVVCDAPSIQVSNTRKALAVLAAGFYGHPSEKLHIIGITGTNGKTTTAYLIENMLAAAGKTVGVIGTVNYRYGGKVFSSPTTTPESLDLQRILAEMVQDGVSHVVLEVSSHAIDLFRIECCDLAMGVFTNLSQDHLDFHGSMDRYWHAKKKLFTHYLRESGTKRPASAVINIDTDKGKALVREISYPCVTVGRWKESMLKPQDIRIDLKGIRGGIITPGGTFTFRSRLIGSYNLENILCAAGAGAALHLPLDVIKTGIEKTSAVPGRLEYVSNGSEKSVYVDFAHTPDALQNVLQSLKGLEPRRMICVFGCGGDRDKAKRPQMGKIAGELCDLVIVTSDNPRTEQPLEIIEQVLAGVKQACPREYIAENLQNGFSQKGHAAEPDRRHAIRLGIDAAQPGDIVLIAGKGHESYQIIGSRKFPFDDRLEAKRVLADPGPHNGGNPASMSQLEGDLQAAWIAFEMAETVKGTLLSGRPDQVFSGISTDSRTITPGDCFLALAGDVHDGHRFVSNVLDKNVKGLIVSKDRSDDLPWELITARGVVSIGVADTLAALGALAARHRGKFAVSVAAITGSNGKTSARSMAAAVLAKRFRVLSPEKNYNNEVGLPLTLLRLRPEHEWAVLELGMNHSGEISRLGDICRPDIGLITNIGPAHLEGLGSLEGVMHAKGELLEKIKAGGKVILNADDPMSGRLAQKAFEKPLWFGLADTADIRGTDIAEHSGGISFTLAVKGEKAQISLCTPGKFMVSNALAAASVGHIAGIPLPQIKSALETFVPIPGRMNLYRMHSNITIIDDTYNANPVSMKAAISTLQDLKKNNRGLVALGDMLELGNASWPLHREIGLFAARAGASKLYATGEFADALAQGAREGGMADSDIFRGAKADIFREIMKVLTSGNWVLVKGSRGMRMETLVKDLINALSKGRS